LSGAHHPRHEELHITDARINERIRVPEVRLVGPNGEQVGIVRVEDALRLAQEADLDLVEVAPDARPPVCKLMDYGKFKYEADMKAREARRNQANTVLKEIRFRLKIDPHDYGTKKGHVERFLKVGDKVKVMIMFRGREQSRPEMGLRLLQRLADDVAELGFVESAPRQDGRNMIMVLGPTKKKSEVKGQVKRKPEPRVDAPSVTAPVATATVEDVTAPVAGPVPVAKVATVLPVEVATVLPVEIAETVEAPEVAIDVPPSAEAAPAEVAPAEVVPAKAVPAKAVPAKAVPAKAAPATVAPTEAAPAEAAPGEVEGASAAPAAKAPAKAPKAAPKASAATPAATPSGATPSAPRAMPKPTPRPAPAPAAALKPAPRRPAPGSTAAAPRPTRTPKAPPGDAESS
jgi:translation initiation factor IF-3